VGEEIAYDYSITMLDDPWEMACRCGSRACRKLVREFRFLPPEVRKRYIGLGIVPDYVLRGLAKAGGQ